MSKIPAIIVMCQAPVAGTVKTHLVPFLSAEQAANLAASLTIDTVWKAQLLSLYVFVAFEPSDGKDSLKRILPKHLHWTIQEGNNVSERIHNALVHAFQHDCAPLILLDIDSPTVPSEFIEQALTALSGDNADVVLGKTENGGCYLIGVTQPDLRIFHNVELTSPHTFEQIRNNVGVLKLRLEVMPTWYAVNSTEDLLRLNEEISSDENIARTAFQTAEWLRLNESLFRNR